MTDVTVRPRLHFTPPQNWMNDPNGLVYHQGEYHLFYQYNPHGAAWGHMTWGHAVSPDLLRWEHLPPAIHENAEAGYTIFSGSAVIDAEDTAGFGAGAMVAVFTADFRGNDGGDGLQDVHIAYSLDRGRTFEEYEGNPVIHVGEAKFGDPKVFWHAPTGRWIMVNIEGLPQGHVAIYASDNLRNWERTSEFHDDDKAPGIWECPDLFALECEAEKKWVLKTNNVYGPKGAVEHATRYWVGDFDGRAFTAETPARRYRPEDDPFYAEVTYSDDPGDGSSLGRRIMFGWLRQGPADHRPWTGAQSLPRELSLVKVGDGYALCHAPVREIDALRTPRTLAVWGRDLDARSPFLLAEGLAEGDTALDVELGTSWQPCSLLLTTASGKRLELWFAPERGAVLMLGDVEGARGIDVLADGTVDQEPDKAHRVDVPHSDRLALRVIIDGPIIEAFAGPSNALGSSTLTAIVAPDNDPIDRVELANGDLDALHVYDLAL